MIMSDDQIITGYPIDGAMGSSGGGRVRKLSVVCLHNNAIIARDILVTILHRGTPEPCLSAIYIVSSAGTSLNTSISFNKIDNVVQKYKKIVKEALECRNRASSLFINQYTHISLLSCCY